MPYVPQIIPPVVNLNGTSKEALLNQHCSVLDHLRIARKYMAEAMPHGRDFQTLPANIYQNARADARNRFVLIDQLIADFEALALKIADQ